MSNITTSYIRIFRRDRQAFNEEESDHLLHLAARSYGEFGSYWVRILKKLRYPEKCLDIQFGSAKRFHSDNLLETYDIFNMYIIWERIADEGGQNDGIFTFGENKEEQIIETEYRRDCLYLFDKIKICYWGELPDYILSLEPKELNANTYELNYKGSYYAINSRSFMDLDKGSKFYGPQLGYDPFYASDYFVPIENEGGITETEDKLISGIFIHPYPLLPIKMRVELYFKNRLVQSIENKGYDYAVRSADYWDNCGDAAYLSFIKNR